MKLSLLTFVVALASVLSACNKNEGSGATPAPGVCPAGQVQTQYGCLMQGMCPAGQAQHNGTCIQAINTACPAGTVNTYQGCLPQGSCQVGYAQHTTGCIPQMPVTGSGYNPGYYGGQYNYQYQYGTGYPSYPYMPYPYYSQPNCRVNSWGFYFCTYY